MLLKLRSLLLYMKHTKFFVMFLGGQTRLIWKPSLAMAVLIENGQPCSLEGSLIGEPSGFFRCDDSHELGPKIMCKYEAHGSHVDLESTSEIARLAIVEGG